VPSRISNQDKDKLLAGRHVAVLVTIGPDGEPVPSPIWYLFRDGVFYFRTASNAIKTRNIRRDPRVSICVQDERPPYRALIAYGQAELGQEQDWLAREMARHYLGAVGAMGYRAAARENIEQGAEVTIIVRPTRFTTFDFSADTPLVGKIWLWLKRFLPPQL